MAQYTRTLGEQFSRIQITVGWPWKLLVFSAFIFAFSVFLYFGMTIGYKPYLSSSTRNLNQKIDKLGLQIKEEEKASFLVFYSQLVNLAKLLDRHIQGGNVFDFLEKHVQQNVYYEIVTVALNNRFIRLQGVARDYAALTEQIVALEGAAMADQVFLDNAQLNEKGVNFVIRLVVKPEFFNFNPPAGESGGVSL